jgi:hypothetical protein
LTISDLFTISMEIVRANRWLKRVLWLRCLTWHTTIGLGDPALTGTVAGILWGYKYYLWGKLPNYLRIHAVVPNIKVTPSFFERTWDWDFSCIFTIRSGYIILVALKTMIVLLKWWWQRKGVGRWSIPSQV